MAEVEQPRKTTSHGGIGEAVVTAKCWMNGVPAHNTNGLRANFAGSDLIIDAVDPSKKLLIQVKTGYSPGKNHTYLTQASGEHDLTMPKFKADFVVPADVANNLFRDAVQREFDRPLIKTGQRRKLTNLAVTVEPGVLDQYRDAWRLLRGEQLSSA